MHLARVCQRRRDAGIVKSWPDTVIGALAEEHGLAVVPRNTNVVPDVTTVNPWNE